MTPNELLGIMKKSIIKTGFLKNTSVYGRPEYLVLTEDLYGKGVNTNGESVPVLNIKNYNSLKSMDKHLNYGGRFLSYICDYQKNALSYQVLGSESDFMFTITMNGCTFGAGAPSASGDVLVSHGNQASPPEGQQFPTGTQSEKQLALATSFHGNGTEYLEPSQYRPNGKNNSTTFGIRIDGGWKFHYQTYSYLGQQTFQLNELCSLNGNLIG